VKDYFHFIYRRNNRILKHKRTIKIDIPADWYRFQVFYTNEEEKLEHFLDGLICIFKLENLDYTPTTLPATVRECIQTIMCVDRKSLKVLAKKYNFTYIIYATRHTNQLVALHFLSEKSEFLFRIKYAECLFV